MATPNYNFQLVASPVSGTVPSGYAMVKSNGSYVTSTSAARGTTRSSGISIGAAGINGATVMQSSGDLDPTISQLQPGTVGPIRVSTTGALERCTPSSGDDVVGWVEADGTAHVLFGCLPWNFWVISTPTATEELQNKTINPTKNTIVSGPDGEGMIASGGEFISQNLVYAVPPPALQTWRAALANRFFSPASIAVIGDSITEGQGASAMAYRWTQRLADLLRARFPVPGVVGGLGFLSPEATGETTFTWPVTKSGSILSNTNFGAKRLNKNLQTTGVYTFTVTGTSIDVCYVQQTSTATATVVVDSGSPTTINGYGATGTGGLKYRIPLGAAGTHTVTISGATGNFFFTGIIVYNGDENSGIHVHDCGIFGQTTAGWAAAPNGTTAWPADIAALSPQLLIIELMENDAIAATPPATSQANIQTLLSCIRATGINPSVLLLPPWVRTTISDATWATYVAVARAIAASDPMVVSLALSSRMPDVTSDVLGLYADGVHPSNKGHSMMADIVADFISPW